MSRRKWVSFLGCLTPLLLLGACSEREGRTGTGDWTGVCIDADGDGYGFQCAAGPDCNDTDSQIHTGCGACDLPNEACPCQEGTEPVDCTLPYELTTSGALLCKEGTRYCRDGVWTACEGIRSFVAPAASELGLGVRYQGLVGDAGTDAGSRDAGVCGDPCNPDCFRVDDALKEFDGGADGGIVPSTTGGITLGSMPGMEAPIKDAGNVDEYVCTLGQPPDKDCDRIPDAFDSFPEEPPFETSHNTIFADLAPGQTVNTQIDIKFKIATADIYFYLDMTGSMEGERDNLIEDLTSGNFLPADVRDKDCSDRNFDGTPDNYLKTGGIAGNIACLIRDAQFGAGWFRDLPLNDLGPDDYEMFENRLDITDNVNALYTALNGFQTRGGNDAPEGSMQGLYALATGKEVHAGWTRPGIPARTTCPPGTWGYPCFRDGSVPIIIHVTDEGLHAGPPEASTGTGSNTYPFAYSSSTLSNKVSAGTPDPVTGNYYRALTSSAETFATPQDFGTIDGKLITYAGSTEHMNSDVTYLTANSCGTGSAWSSSSQGAPDAVFKFTVGSRVGGVNRTVTLSSAGSRFDSTIMLLNAPPAITTTATANNGTFATATNLGTITTGQRMMVTGNTSGHTALHAREGLTLASTSTCFGNATANDLAPAAVHKFQLATNNMTLRFSGSGGTGQNVALFSSASIEPTVTDLTAINCGSGTASNCNDRLDQYAVGTVNGKYLHLVNGDLTHANLASDYTTEFGSCSGTYTNTTADAVFNFKVSATTTVRIETAGSGTSLSTGMPHGISLLRKSGSSYTVVGCSSSSSDRASIEQSLTAGDYAVIVKGQRVCTASIFGFCLSYANYHPQYNLTIRDLNVAPKPIHCHNEASAASFTASSLPRLDGTGQPITYYVVTRSNGVAGNYQLLIEDPSTTATTTNVCSDNNSTYGNDGQISRQLAPGTYYAVLKGKTLNEKGIFQMTIGDGSSTTQNFAPKTWKDHIKAAVQERAIRVIMVNSVGGGLSGGGTWNPSSGYKQTLTLAKETEAPTVSATKTYEINSSGSGMGSQIITAISDLTKKLTMDLTVRLVPLPNNVPTRPFGFAVTALPGSGNCTGGISADKTTHRTCGPGAEPKFNIAISNPLEPNHVPSNPNDPSGRGGYSMKLELVGSVLEANGQTKTYVVDEVPVYIIPEDVITDPILTPAQYHTSAYYEEIVSSACAGTSTPVWRSLYWDATVPAGTSIDWKLCGGDTDQDARTCELVLAGKVTSGARCTSNANCPNGYCSSSGVCEYVAGPACSSNADCGNGGVCVTVSNVKSCRWTQNPIDLLPTLAGGFQGKRKIRLNVTLNASADRFQAPAVNDWHLEYRCSPGL